MKKKIRDLTLENIINICAHTHCLNCPLHNNCIDECMLTDVNLISSETLNKEIEVEKNEKVNNHN